MPEAAQNFIPIQEIRDGVVILKTGEMRSVLICSSINFDLKSEDEQAAIISQYQNFLNSLDFSLQMFVQSRKFNVVPYLATLDERLKNEMNELIDTYASGSLDSLYALYKDKELSNSFQRALVTDRNHRMADRIAERLAGKNLRMFVAIGALHLPSEEGVIDLLRKKGYSVTPIKLN